MSLMGLYLWDNDILNSFVLPSGVDSNILFPDLLSECAEFEILYPEPDTFKTILAAWSGHRKTIWERIFKLSIANYNPIENYDRKETWNESATGNTNDTLNQTQKNYQAGYNPNLGGNAPALVQQEQSENSGTDKTNSSGTSNHSGWIHGNIGVTTTQQMMEQEIEISDKLDIYNYIIADFKKRFCIPLY